MGRGLTAPLWTMHPTIGDAADLLEDRANESDTPTCTAVHLQGTKPVLVPKQKIKSLKMFVYLVSPKSHGKPVKPMFFSKT